MSKSGSTTRSTAEGGFSIVEVAMATFLVVVGLLGFLSAILSTQMMVRVNRENSIANKAVANVVEQFRAECGADFDAALAAYSAPQLLAGVDGLGNANIVAQAVLDEVGQQPPVDLNGDGDVVDMAVAPAAATAAIFEVELTWTGAVGDRRIGMKTIFARRDFD